MYRYHATLVRIIDGDTLDLSVDLGFRIKQQIRVRLADIDAPEIRGEHKEAGRAAVRWLSRELNRPEQLIVETRKTGKYGRWLATLYVGDTTKSINHRMIANGHAIPYPQENPQ